MKIYAKRALLPSGWAEARLIETDGDRIVSVGAGNRGEIVCDVLVPGLIDLHNHGGGGFGVNEPDREGLRSYLLQQAIRAGVEVLLQAKGVDTADVSRVYLAGGFGSALDPRSAAAIGLLPRSVAARAVGVGNASLAGAALMLDASARDRGVELARSAELIELGGNARFAELFIARMAFA